MSNDALDHLAAQKQRSWHSPALVAAVQRDGTRTWSTAIGAPDVSRPEDTPTLHTPFAIGSISKTFTAALILRLRDSGELTLADDVGRYLPELPRATAALTVRDLLAHASGLQREPVSDVWDSLQMPTIEELLAGMPAAEQVLAPRLRFHYSNLAFALLGEVAARAAATSWFEAVRSQLLTPLGMTETSLQPPDGRAVGYYADPFADRVRIEPWPDMGGFAAAGGLWSTAEDLLRWAQFWIAGNSEVLSEATVEEMSRPQMIADLDRWTAGYGLGLQLLRRGERIFVGHGGAMPGFLAGLLVRRVDRAAAVVLVNCSAEAAPTQLAAELLTTSLDDDPAREPPWRPGPDVPAELEPLLGRWWTEGEALAFAFRDGALQARMESAPADAPPAIFERVGEDRYRAVSGREEGELLRVERDADGNVRRLKWATYPVTRDPETFG